MKKYDLIVLLGSQVKIVGNKYELAPHTKLKAEAAAIAYHKGITEKFIVSGGYNFWVRYNENQILIADFSFDAFVRGRSGKSEAEIIRNFMKKQGVPKETIFLEEASATTQENAEILKILLSRTTFDSVKKIALLTLGYHMKSAFLVFKKTLVSTVIIEPLFTEDLLGLDGRTEDICQYYSTPKANIQWDIKKIRELLNHGKSVKEIFLK